MAGYRVPREGESRNRQVPACVSGHLRTYRAPVAAPHATRPPQAGNLQAGSPSKSTAARPQRGPPGDVNSSRRQSRNPSRAASRYQSSCAASNVRPQAAYLRLRARLSALPVRFRSTQWPCSGAAVLSPSAWPDRYPGVDVYPTLRL